MGAGLSPRARRNEGLCPVRQSVAPVRFFPRAKVQRRVYQRRAGYPDHILVGPDGIRRSAPGGPAPTDPDEEREFLRAEQHVERLVSSHPEKRQAAPEPEGPP